MLVERRAAEPVLPLWVVSRRVLVGGNLASLVVGALLIGLTSYLPTYAQGVLGAGPLVAGFALAALTIGWPIAASLSGRLYLRIGFRNTALIGASIVIVGAVFTALLTADVADLGGGRGGVRHGHRPRASPRARRSWRRSRWSAGSGAAW